MLFLQLFAHVHCFGTCTLVSIESSFSIHALMKNVACIGYIYVLECNSLKVAFICALMKNVASNGYMCCRIIGYLCVCVCVF